MKMQTQAEQDVETKEFVEEADLVVGADGARATLRSSLSEHQDGKSGETSLLDR